MRSYSTLQYVHVLYIVYMVHIAMKTCVATTRGHNFVPNSNIVSTHGHFDNNNNDVIDVYRLVI